MDNRENRWVAGISLLSLFAIIACAGGRAAPRAQTTQNVLVTNTTSQPIPIAARPGNGAYIVSVANAPQVKVVASATAPVATKEVNNPDGNSAISQGTINLDPGILSVQTPPITLSSTSPTVIDAVNFVTQSATSGEAVVLAQVFVYYGGTQRGAFGYLLTQGLANYSAFDGHTRIPVLANGNIVIQYTRSAATHLCGTQLNIAFHTVPNP